MTRSEFEQIGAVAAVIALAVLAALCTWELFAVLADVTTIGT